VIRGSYELKSPLTVTTLTAQTLADRNFATFVADTVDKNSAVLRSTLSGSMPPSIGCLTN